MLYVEGVVDGMVAACGYKPCHVGNGAPREYLVQNKEALLDTAVWPRVFVLAKHLDQEEEDGDVAEMFQHVGLHVLDVLDLLGLCTVVLGLHQHRPRKRR
ncbi:hypothetical protein G6F58_013469 [Rhizopus delemar]|nr:hypothetical protein G6F58_013469 [Rhizopus delemar]